MLQSDKQYAHAINPEKKINISVYVDKTFCSSCKKDLKQSNKILEATSKINGSVVFSDDNFELSVDGTVIGNLKRCSPPSTLRIISLLASVYTFAIIPAFGNFDLCLNIKFQRQQLIYEYTIRRSVFQITSIVFLGWAQFFVNDTDEDILADMLMEIPHGIKSAKEIQQNSSPKSDQTN